MVRLLLLLSLSAELYTICLTQFRLPQSYFYTIVSIRIRLKRVYTSAANPTAHAHCRHNYISTA